MEYTKHIGNSENSYNLMELLIYTVHKRSTITSKYIKCSLLLICTSYVRIYKQAFHMSILNDIYIPHNNDYRNTYHMSIIININNT